MPKISNDLAAMIAHHVVSGGAQSAWDTSGKIRKFNPPAGTTLPANLSSDHLATARAHLQHAISAAASVKTEHQHTAVTDYQQTVVEELIRADRRLSHAYPGSFDPHHAVTDAPQLTAHESKSLSTRHQLYDTIMPDLWRAASALSQVPPSAAQHLPDPLAIALSAKSRLLSSRIPSPKLGGREKRQLQECAEHLEGACEQVGYAKCSFPAGSPLRSTAERLEKILASSVGTLNKLIPSEVPAAAPNLSGNHYLRQDQWLVNQYLYSARDALIKSLAGLLKLDTPRMNQDNADKVNTLSSQLHQFLREVSGLTEQNMGTATSGYHSYDDAIPEAAHSSWRGTSQTLQARLPFKPPVAFVLPEVGAAMLQAQRELHSGDPVLETKAVLGLVDFAQHAPQEVQVSILTSLMGHLVTTPRAIDPVITRNIVDKSLEVAANDTLSAHSLVGLLGPLFAATTHPRLRQHFDSLFSTRLTTLYSTIVEGACPDEVKLELAHHVADVLKNTTEPQFMKNDTIVEALFHGVLDTLKSVRQQPKRTTSEVSVALRESVAAGPNAEEWWNNEPIRRSLSRYARQDYNRHEMTGLPQPDQRKSLIHKLCIAAHHSSSSLQVREKNLAALLGFSQHHSLQHYEVSQIDSAMSEMAIPYDLIASTNRAAEPILAVA